MNNLERIVAKILEEASVKAKFILDDANKNANEILEKSKNSAVAKIEQIKKEYEITEKAEIDRIKSATALKSRNIILEAKQEGIKYIFDELYSQIKNIPLDKVKEYILRILQNRGLGENDKLILPTSYKDLNLGYECEYSDKVKSGFLIEHNNIFENYTLEALINSKKDEIEQKIQELFNV